MPDPIRRRATHALSHGRSSLAGTTYFVTACTLERKSGLTTPAVANGILAEFTAAAGAEHTIAATIMPDHVHLLVNLGESLTLPQIVARAKAKSRAVLSAIGLTWQRGFHDRRLRESESLESYALYLFLNPYRASLLSLDQTWPWTRFGAGVRFKFLDDFRATGTVRPEWLTLESEWQSASAFSPH